MNTVSQIPSQLEVDERNKDAILCHQVCCLINAALGHNYKHLGEQLERAIYRHCVFDRLQSVSSSQQVKKDLIKTYRNRARLVIANLKKNNTLRNALLQHQWTPEKVARMTAQELNPLASHWKVLSQRQEALILRQREEDEDLKRKKSIIEQESGSWKERCPKCKSTSYSSYQLQTCSADEPMTTFYECDCGKKWKR